MTNGRAAWNVVTSVNDGEAQNMGRAEHLQHELRYDKADEFERRVQSLKRYRRPLLCTEYMARGNGSTFEGSLPIAKKHNVAAYNWGLVIGKTQTHELAYGPTTANEYAGPSRNPWNPEHVPGGSSCGAGYTTCASITATSSVLLIALV